MRFEKHHWALILGGSSGFGLASAKKLSAEGLNVCVVHRDRRGAMDRITPEFDAIRANGHGFLSLNLDALSAEGMAAVITALAGEMGPEGRVRVLLHSIAFGNLRPVVTARRKDSGETAADRFARALNVPKAEVDRAIKELADDGETAFQALDPIDYGEAVLEDEDMARTVYAMGTSLLTWVQQIYRAGLFAPDARVLGLTSEGNEIAWRGYAAVAAAKSALESVSRAIAVEFAPYGIRSNIVQPGVTDTPALRIIPGAARMKAGALRRNPLGRLTTPEDVADVIYLLCLDEARWVNGAIIRVDGGEHVA